MKSVDLFWDCSVLRTEALANLEMIRVNHVVYHSIK
jgi:hypothetical protein